MGRITVGTVVLLAAIVPQVLVSGVFELRLGTFVNDEGRLAEGDCCGACPGVCATMFRICLKHYQATIDPKSCTFGEIRTPVLGNNSINLVDHTVAGFDNPVKFPFSVQTWPGTFSLIIEAWNRPSNTTTGEGNHRALITRLMTQRWLNVSPEWTQDSHTTNYTAMTYYYRFTCDTNYYEPSCEKFCRPRDDKFGHYTCSSTGDKICLPGWTGEYCSNPVCQLGCHEQHGFCRGPNGCECRMGWQGQLCDQCIRYPGCMHGTCNQPWQCNCDEGWGGLFCNQDLNYCTNNKPCKNGGTCTNTGQGSYTCTCVQGFTGTNCDTHLDACVDLHQPCLNGGTCQSTENNYTCECPVGFYGRHCDTTASSCTENPCLNGGTCIDNGHSFYCHCSNDFKGLRCDIPKSACDVNPCMNGGVCAAAEEGYTCRCPPNYTGNVCEKNLDECSVVSCRNGGTCAEGKCTCIPGFVGSSCEVNVDDCLTKPCANGGTCYDLINDYSCVCQPGFTGKDCSFNIDECGSNPCLNGGTCEDRVVEFVCLCPEGYSGSTCEVGSEVKSLQHHTDGAMSHQVSEKLSNKQIALIATLSSAVPVTVCLAVMVILALKCKKTREQRRQEEEEIRRQNEQNSMNNKYADKQIYNTLDRPPKTLKLTNEKSLAYTKELQRTKSVKLLNTAHDRDWLSKQNSMDTRHPAAASTSHSERRIQDPSIYVIEIQDPTAHPRLENVLATEV